MDSFKLKLRTLSTDAQTFSYTVDTSFFSVAEPIEVRHASVEARLQAQRRDADTVAMELTCIGELVVACDRCLGDLRHPVDTAYAFTVSQRGSDYDDNGEGLVTVPADATEVDIEPIVRDTILLTIPLVHVHDGSNGNCDPDMLDVLDSHATDQVPEPQPQAETDPRWDALKKLKEQ